MGYNYNEVLSEWYRKLWPRCMRVLASVCPSLSLEDAENVYQDAFLAVYENIANGRVKENTAWDSYIIRICVNLGCKTLRKVVITDPISEVPGDDDYGVMATNRKVEIAMQILTEDQKSLYDDIEVQAILGKELSHTSEPCASIIRMYYYNTKMSMAEIADEVGLKNADTAKSRKSQCMADLIERVTASLKRAGFDVQPKKRNSNGKN
jgi:RNA polymerase sigma factor (sigma-70 family)